ncbi:MAG: bifunctional enoyl-CoA hydratase/phosphate acetyltransferase [Amphiplicatus sp.]
MPDDKITAKNVAMAADPMSRFEKGERLLQLIERAKEFEPVNTAVVHAVEPVSLRGTLAAAEAKLITPIFIAPKEKLEKAAKDVEVSLDGYEIFDAAHSHDAAAIAVDLARKGRADAIMKGALHTDEIMCEVVSGDSGLRTERRLSHIYVMDAPLYPKLLFITDAAINIAPTLDEKRDIVQNAIDLARALGVEVPKVAILSAVETVYPKIASTIDAAALCKMADRGQIRGGVLDGPLAFDNAISPEAAATKGLKSPVAGQADILAAPDIDAGNILAKQLDYLAGAVAAGIVLGARVPIMLTSRAETSLPRMASCAVASLYIHRRIEAAL